MSEWNVQAGPGNWLVKLFVLLMLALAALFGFVIFLVVLGVALFTLLGMMLRFWWLNRRRRPAAAGSGALEGEYVVVRETLRSEQKPRD